MSVREAGRKGGEVTAKRQRAPVLHEEIGRKGGQTVKRLIGPGKRAE